MTEKQELENERDQEIRLRCIDLATRVVGKPIYLANNTKQHDDVVKVAISMYEFVNDE